MQVVKEQRLEQRLDQRLSLYIQFDGSAKIAGETLDLSSRGLSCRLPCYVPPFSRLSIDLLVPIPFRGFSPVTLEAVAVRVEQDAADDASYVLGCLFLQLDQEKADLVSRLVSTLEERRQPAPNHFATAQDTQRHRKCLSTDFNPQGFLNGGGLTRLDRMACLGELSSILAHEIKNPLACLAGSLQVLSEEIADNYPSEDLFSELFGQIERIDTIVDHLLQFSATESPQMKPVRLDNLLDNTLCLLDGKLKEKNVKVNLCHGASQPMINADERLLRQAFLNLFANVVDDAGDAGQLCINTHWQSKIPVCGRPACECFTNAAEQGISVVVMNFGDAQNRGREYRLPLAERKKRGLNLSMTQQIIEQHHGSVFIQDQPEENSVLLVNLPL